MTIWVENPFAGFEVGWTWAQHQAAGFEGGTDYIFYPSDGPLRAAADGVVSLAAGQNGFTPGKAIILSLSDGRQVNYREVASANFSGTKTVKRGDPIGQPNKAGRWPHIDAVVGGVRVPFEPLVNVGTDPAGGGDVIIVEGETVVTVYADGGPAAPINPNPTSFWIGAPGVWEHIDNSKFGSNVIAVLTQAFNQPITMFTSDLTNVGNLWLSLAPASAPGGGASIAQIHTELQSLATTADLPTTEQLGQALTSTVSLVDSHVDSQFAGLILKTS